jgi:hypothetical protein
MSQFLNCTQKMGEFNNAAFQVVELFQHFAQTQVHAFEIGPRRQSFFSALKNKVNTQEIYTNGIKQESPTLLPPLFTFVDLWCKQSHGDYIDSVFSLVCAAAFANYDSYECRHVILRTYVCAYLCFELV